MRLCILESDYARPLLNMGMSLIVRECGSAVSSGHCNVGTAALISKRAQSSLCANARLNRREGAPPWSGPTHRCTAQPRAPRPRGAGFAPARPGRKIEKLKRQVVAVAAPAPERTDWPAGEIQR